MFAHVTLLPYLTASSNDESLSNACYPIPFRPLDVSLVPRPTSSHNKLHPNQHIAAAPTAYLTHPARHYSSRKHPIGSLRHRSFCNFSSPNIGNCPNSHCIASVIASAQQSRVQKGLCRRILSAFGQLFDRDHILNQHSTNVHGDQGKKRNTLLEQQDNSTTRCLPRRLPAR